jgi:hypothetical protein
MALDSTVAAATLRNDLQRRGIGEDESESDSEQENSSTNEPDSADGDSEEDYDDDEDKQVNGVANPRGPPGGKGDSDISEDESDGESEEGGGQHSELSITGNGQAVQRVRATENTADGTRPVTGSDEEDDDEDNEYDEAEEEP